MRKGEKASNNQGEEGSRQQRLARHPKLNVENFSAVRLEKAFDSKCKEYIRHNR